MTIIFQLALLKFPEQRQLNKTKFSWLRISTFLQLPSRAPSRFLFKFPMLVLSVPFSLLLHLFKSFGVEQFILTKVLYRSKKSTKHSMSFIINWIELLRATCIEMILCKPAKHRMTSGKKIKIILYSLHSSERIAEHKHNQHRNFRWADKKNWGKVATVNIPPKRL